MSKFIQDIFTEKDGQSWSLARVGWGISLLVFLGLAVWDVTLQKSHFDMQSFGIGLGAVIAAGGVAIGWQAKTEADVK